MPPAPCAPPEGSSLYTPCPPTQPPCDFPNSQARHPLFQYTGGPSYSPSWGTPAHPDLFLPSLILSLLVWGRSPSPHSDLPCCSHVSTLMDPPTSWHKRGALPMSQRHSAQGFTLLHLMNPIILPPAPFSLWTHGFGISSPSSETQSPRLRTWEHQCGESRWKGERKRGKVQSGDYPIHRSPATPKPCSPGGGRQAGDMLMGLGTGQAPATGGQQEHPRATTRL